MLFFPQGYKSGKMLSGSGSTPMRSASLSARIQQLWGEPMNPVRLLWTGQLSRTFPSGFAVLSAGNGTSKKATAGLALFVLIDVMDCINVTQRTDITRGGGAEGVVSGSFCCFLTSKMMLLLKLLRARTSRLLARVGDVDLPSPLCCCDHGWSCACKLPCSRDRYPDLPLEPRALTEHRSHRGADLTDAGGGGGSSAPRPLEPARANESENEEPMLS